LTGCPQAKSMGNLPLMPDILGVAFGW